MSLVSLLIERRLHERLETWRMDSKVKIFEIGVEPFPTMNENDPSAILIFWLLGQGEYVENRFDKLLIWSKAPEFMIHSVKFSEWTLKALRDLLVRAKEQDNKELEDGDWLNNQYRCFNCSLLNGDASVMVFGLLVAVCMPWPFLLWNLPLFFKFCGFPCSF